MAKSDQHWPNAGLEGAQSWSDLRSLGQFWPHFEGTCQHRPTFGSNRASWVISGPDLGSRSTCSTRIGPATTPQILRARSWLEPPESWRRAHVPVPLMRCSHPHNRSARALPSSAEVGPILTKVGPMWAGGWAYELAQIQPALAETRPSLPLDWPNSAQNWPKVANFG